MKRIYAIFLAVVMLLFVTACSDSTDSMRTASTSSTIESMEATNMGVMYNFYRNVAESLKDGEMDGYDGSFTDSALTFLAEHDVIFEKNESLSDEERENLNTDFDLRDVLKNPERNTSQLFSGIGTITDIREEVLKDGTCVTEGLILCNGINSQEYCYFICNGSVPLYTGDEATFEALPLGVGNVDLTDNTKQRCVYIACASFQNSSDAVNNESFLPDDTGGTDVNAEDSADSLNPISTEDRILSAVYTAVWPGWMENDPAYPQYADLSYGIVMDYLFQDSTYYNWSYDEKSDSVRLNGTYTTFNYTMGMADEPTACNVQLTFTVDHSGNWIVSDFNGDECESGDDFMQLAYSFYYQGNCY